MNDDAEAEVSERLREESQALVSFRKYFLLQGSPLSSTDCTGASERVLIGQSSSGQGCLI